MPAVTQKMWSENTEIKPKRLLDNIVKKEDKLWAEAVLKVMHTIMHADKDLRSNYFNIVQTQIFDRFYKYVFRSDDNKLFIGVKGTEDIVPLVDFETKSNIMILIESFFVFFLFWIYTLSNRCLWYFSNKKQIKYFIKSSKAIYQTN